MGTSNRSAASVTIKSLTGFSLNNEGLAHGTVGEIPLETDIRIFVQKLSEGTLFALVGPPRITIIIVETNDRSVAQVLINKVQYRDSRFVKVAINVDYGGLSSGHCRMLRAVQALIEETGYQCVLMILHAVR